MRAKRRLKSLEAGPKKAAVIYQTLVIVTGLAVAGWGHFLVHDLGGAAAAWSRIDGQFPPSLQSTPWFAGWSMLIMGAILVLAPILG